MPIYEYRCQHCGEKFEVRRGFQEQKGETPCPRCGAQDTRKVFSLFGSHSAGSCAPGPSSFGFG